MSRSACVGRWPLFPSVLQAARLAKIIETKVFAWLQRRAQRNCNRKKHAIASLSMPRTAPARAALIGIGRPAAAEQICSPCSQPCFAEQLKITGPLADDVAGASSPPAAPSHGRAYRTCREQRYGPIDHY